MKDSYVFNNTWVSFYLHKKFKNVANTNATKMDKTKCVYQVMNGYENQYKFLDNRLKLQTLQIELCTQRLYWYENYRRHRFGGKKYIIDVRRLLK